MLDDLGEVQVDLQQQVLAPLTHGTENRGRARSSTSDSLETVAVTVINSSDMGKLVSQLNE